MSFGCHLRSLLEERTMTQKELAKHLSIAPSTLGSYIQNTREPDFATLRTIAEFFHVSIDFLLDHPIGNIATHQEAELVRIFRELDPGQQQIALEQCRVFLRMNHKEKEPSASSY